MVLDTAAGNWLHDLQCVIWNSLVNQSQEQEESNAQLVKITWTFRLVQTNSRENDSIFAIALGVFVVDSIKKSARPN